MPQDNIKQLVENPHPIYVRNVHFWNFLLQSYEGGIDYTKAELVGRKDGMSIDGFEIIVNGKKLDNNIESCNLFKHKNELDEDYLRRIQMSYYYNFCAPIIDIYTSHLFKQQVFSDWGAIEAVIERRRESIDLKGNSISEWRMEISELTQLYGHAFVLADSPRYTGEVRSEQERIDNDLYPYLVTYHPQNVLNWALDERGAAYWVLLREELDANVNPFAFDSKKPKMCQYKLWTRDGWFLYDDKYELIDQQALPLGAVPITCMVNKRSKKASNFLGISELADIAFIARDVYNLCSELKEIIRNQTFAFLALQGDKAEYDQLIIGTGKGVSYPEGMNPPQYVSPDPASADVIMKKIMMQVHKIFQLAKLEGGSVHQEQSAEAQSGASKAWDFNETNSALSKKAASQEDGETRVWQAFAAWEGKEYDGYVRYSRDFNIKSLWDDLEEAEKAFKLNLGVETEKAMKEAIIKKRFQRMPEDDQKKLIEGIPDTPANQPETRNGLRPRLSALNQLQN